MIRGIEEEMYSTSTLNLLQFNNNSNSSTNTSTGDDMSDTCSLVFDEDPIDLVSLTQDDLILKKERIRQQTVAELVKTEINYVRDLKLITKLYIEPIRSHIDIRQYHEVFGCTEGLLNYHREIIHSLEGLPNKPPHLHNVGEILFRFFDSLNYLNLYKEFCSYQNTCIESFEKLKQTSKIFSNCIEGAAKSHLTRGLSFPMLIIKPIQRITKYPLLLKSLLENTPIDHMDYRFINFCYLKINSILEEINHQKRLADDRVENEKKIKEIESSLHNLDHDLKLSVSSTRKFIKEGLVSKKLDKELLRCILLNDILILAKNKKSNSTVKLVIYLENILIRDSIDSLPGYKEGFELLVLNEKKEKIIGLFYSSEAEKKEWLAAVSSLSGGNIDQAKQNKYSWFLKKNSGTFINSSISSNSTSLYSLSSTPTLSIDVSMTPSPRSSNNLNSSNSGSNSNSNSPSLESPSFRQLSGHGSINKIPPSLTTPNGSLRENRKPPPPPSVKDIFGNGKVGGPPYSTNPSPNGTLTNNMIDSISPTFQSTVPSSSNFSRASSVPSFYNLQNDPSSQQAPPQLPPIQDTRHNARRMPQTISSIPQSEDNTTQQKLNVKPPPPPRNHSPYNTISSDSSDYSNTTHPLSAPTSGFNTPLASSCDYVPIKNGTGSKSFTNLLPPPPLLVPPTLPSSKSFTNLLPPPPPPPISELPPPPPPDDEDYNYSQPSNTPPQVPPKTYLYQSTDPKNLPQPLSTLPTSPIPSSPILINKPTTTPPPQTTPPSNLMRAKSPIQQNKPIPAPRTKSPIPTTTNYNNITQSSCTLPNPISFNNSNSAFKKSNSDISLPPPPPLIVKSLPLRSTTTNSLPPPPKENNIISNNNINNLPPPPQIPTSNFQAPINSNCNLINKQQTAFKPLSKSTGISIQGRTTPPTPLSLPTICTNKPTTNK